MASRIIHLAVAGEVIRAHPLPEPNRFFLGSVLPDACADKQAHYNKLLEDGTKKPHDLTGFRQRYGSRLGTDSLYLGYYLHLLQDVLYRYEMFEVVGFDPRPPENIPQLHVDYQLTNRYVIDRYGLTDRIRIPEGLEAEPLWKECRFTLEPFLHELAQDFHAAPHGRTRHFTEAIADELIRRSAAICLAELDALQAGTGFFDENRFAWKVRTPEQPKPAEQ